ncbi:MAG: phosphohistidine phosphatase SixA [Anaerolineae bacterium]|nr:phosphohistidine phosphatase SixA [Anaerolineae bacterium]
MRVILVRHGKASKDPTIPTDAARPLTDRGREDVANVGKLLAEAGIKVVQIRHSGLVRAQQTAEILGELLDPRDGVIAVRGLHYADPVAPLARELRYEPEPVMLVGHNPFMERLVAAMLLINMGRTPVWFATSTTACLDYIEGEWSLKWVLHRELVS